MAAPCERAAVVMRFAGLLHDWNEQRGFGFIRPLEGGDPVFVHVSALPSPRPALEEVLTFEVAVDGHGRKKAVHVRRRAAEASALQVDRARDAQRTRVRQEGSRGRSRRSVVVQALVTAVALVLVGSFGYEAYRERSARQAPGQAAGEEASVPLRHAAPGSAGGLVRSGAFTCDGRTRCEEMRSCDEAKFFLSNCPGTVMDGDRDGTPCEQQWCTGWR